MDSGHADRLMQLVIYWSASLFLRSKLQSLYARTERLKHHELLFLGTAYSNLFFFIKSIKHFDFLDVPDAKVAVPPQKPAEGRVTNHTCSIVLFYICTEAAGQWGPQRKILVSSAIRSS